MFHGRAHVEVPFGVRQVKVQPNPLPHRDMSGNLNSDSSFTHVMRLALA